MRRFFSVAVMAVTAYFLIATSRAPCSTTAETVTLTSRGTCGPETTVTVAIDTACRVTVSPVESGLPPGGHALLIRSGTLVNQDLNLYTQPDAGLSRSCTLSSNGAGTGWDVECVSSSCADDGGCECSGTVGP